MINKKAQVFEQGLVIVVFALCLVAFTSFLLYNQKVKASMSEIYPVVQMFDEAGKIQFYVNDSEKIAVQNAYSESIKEIGKDCAKSAENVNYAIWKENCMLTNEQIQEKFLFSLNQTMSELLNQYSGKKPILNSISAENNKVSFVFSEFNLTSSVKKMNNIQIDYNLNLNNEFDLNNLNINLDMETVYDAVLRQWQTCKKSADFNSAKNCMTRQIIEGWSLNVRNEGFLCELNSKTKYYTKNGFEQLVIKLKLER